MTIEISGQTIYELDPDGVNRWSANVQPGTGLDGYRQPDSVIDRVAKRLYVADFYHERLVEALWHAMQCWEYDGVSDEHAAVAMHCSELLAALKAEKGGEL